MTKKRNIPILNKSDIILFTVLVLAGAAITVWIYLPGSRPASYLEVRQNGTVLMTLPLDTDTEQTVRDENGGTNTFQVKDNSVIMLAADCGDHTCINTGRISRTGESIVCLPHRLALQITASGSQKEDDTPDAMVH